MKKRCETCKWGKWELTRFGNIRRDTIGKCIFPTVATPVMPSCTYDQVKDYLNWRKSIWPADGANCPCYEVKP